MRKAAFVLALSAVLPAHAEENVDASTRYELARVIVGEADGSRTDWAAILWTLRHRQGLGDLSLRAVAEYSAVLRANTARAQSIRTLGTKTPDLGALSRLRRRQWDEALRFVDSWLHGDVPDPCPTSMHWGGETDVKPEGRTVVDCGVTKNEFYFVERKAWPIVGKNKTSTAGTTASRAKTSTKQALGSN